MWGEVRLKDIVLKCTNGFVGLAKIHYTENDNGVLYIQGFNVKANGFNLSGIKKITPEFHKNLSRSELEIGDLLTVQSGKIGLTTIVPKNLEGANCHALIITRFDTRLAEPNYFVQYFNSEIGLNHVLKIQTGTTIKHINVKDFVRLKILLPPLPEQKKIAEILSTWDEGIDKLENLIEKKETLKKGLIEELLNSKVSSWISSPINKLFEIVAIRSKKYLEILSVTQDQGVVPRNSLSKKISSSTESIASYKVIEPGEFAVSLRSFQGGLEFSAFKGIISPAYTVLRAKVEGNMDYFRHFFKTAVFIKKFLVKSVIGIRDGKQISIPDFMQSKIAVPDQEEQQRIASILTTTDIEIQKLKEKLEKVKEQKKGLMQVLLTGTIRVKT